MEPLVLLDTNVILARCLDPSMDSKAELAKGVFKVLSDAGLGPCITESVRQEFEAKLHLRVGQIIDALRSLSRGPVPSLPTPNASGLGVLEVLFSRLRKQLPESAGALQLLETRLVKGLESSKREGDWWTTLLTKTAVETTGVLAEIQKRFDTLGIEVLRRPPNVDHERFRNVVQKRDLEHIASAAGLAESRKSPIIFVTLESPLHGARDEISKIDPAVVVTTPAYLQGQIQRLRTVPSLR